MDWHREGGALVLDPPRRERSDLDLVARSELLDWEFLRRGVRGPVAAYPASLDNLTTAQQDDVDSTTGVDPGTTTNVGYHAALHRDANTAVNAIETELGLTPKGGYASVAERLQARDLKDSCRAATTAALPAATYANGTSGVGATLTANANGALPAQDGVSLSVGDRLFVKDQITGGTPAAHANGIYTVTSLGSGAAPWVLTRVIDADTAVKLSDSCIVTVESTASLTKGSVWELSTANPITVGTTALRFTRQFPAYPIATRPATDVWLPTSVKMESLDSSLNPIVNIAPLTSGTLRLSPLGVIRAGESISQVQIPSGSTAGATLTHSWAGLVRVSDRQLMAVSTDNVTASWAVSTLRTYSWTAYTPDRDELFWLALMVSGTTVPSMNGQAQFTAATAIPPAPASRATGGNSNTTQTTPLAVGTIVTAPTASGFVIYAAAG